MPWTPMRWTARPRLDGPDAAGPSAHRAQPGRHLAGGRHALQPLAAPAAPELLRLLDRFAARARRVAGLCTAPSCWPTPACSTDAAPPRTGTGPTPCSNAGPLTARSQADTWLVATLQPLAAPAAPELLRLLDGFAARAGASPACGAFVLADAGLLDGRRATAPGTGPTPCSNAAPRRRSRPTASTSPTAGLDIRRHDRRDRPGAGAGGKGPGRWRARAPPRHAPAPFGRPITTFGNAQAGAQVRPHPAGAGTCAAQPGAAAQRRGTGPGGQAESAPVQPRLHGRDARQGRRKAAARSRPPDDRRQSASAGSRGQGNGLSRPAPHARGLPARLRHAAAGGAARTMP